MCVVKTASRDDAHRRHAHLNDGHIPDIIEYATPPRLYEWKTLTPRRSHDRGLGSSSFFRGREPSRERTNSFKRPGPLRELSREPAPAKQKRGSVLLGHGACRFRRQSAEPGTEPKTQVV